MKSLRIQVLSDLHLERYNDGGVAFLKTLDPADVDVLAMAGDICSYSMLETVLPAICCRYHDATVIFVAGNHEPYYSSIDNVREITKRLSCDVGNLEVLDNRLVDIDGFRILGTTLFFPQRQLDGLYSQELNDFRRIADFKFEVYTEHEIACYFLKEKVKTGDIVITHHLPSFKCVHPSERDSHLNRFFHSDLDDIILEKRPSLWIHGHSHHSGDVAIGATRVLCNPFGYVDYEINPDWDPKLVVEIDPL